jgi:outer membrane protein assembly factor BamB
MTHSSKSKWPWFPIISFGLAGLAVFWIRSLPEFERNLKGWLTAGIPLVVLLLNLLWLAFTKR